MFTQNVETIEPFSSHIVPVKVGRAYTGGNTGRKPQWPGQWWHYLCQTTYRGPVAGGGDELQGPHTPRLTVRQRHGKLFDE